jgi:3,4-dihydroxy-2-butanone 4-phosphate synthase
VVISFVILTEFMLQYVIVVDDEDRENEGDLIMAASKVTPEDMAFIVRHGTGIVCVSMKEDDLERLELPLMVVAKENEEKLRTAFTVSVVRCLNIYCFVTIIKTLDTRGSPS